MTDPRQIKDAPRTPEEFLQAAQTGQEGAALSQVLRNSRTGGSTLARQTEARPQAENPFITFRPIDLDAGAEAPPPDNVLLNAVVEQEEQVPDISGYSAIADAQVAAQLDVLRSNINDVVDPRFQAVDQQLEDLRTQVATLETGLAETSNRLDNTIRELQDTQSELQQTIGRLDQAESDLAAAQEQIETLEQELNSTRDELSTQIQEVAGRVDVTETDIGILIGQIEALQAQVSQLQQTAARPAGT